MMKTKLVLIFCFVFYSLWTLGQENKDSLKKEWKKLKNKAHKLANETKLDSAIIYFNKASELAKKHELWNEYFKTQNAMLIRLTYVYKLEEMNKLTIQIEKEIIEKLGKKNIHMARLLRNKAALELHHFEYSKAIAYMQKAIKIVESLPNKKSSLATEYRNMGVVYQNVGNSNLALKYFFKALEIHILLEQEKGQTLINYSIANAYYSQEEYHKSLEHLEREWKIIEEHEYLQKDKSIVSQFHLLYAKVCNELKKDSLALSHYQRGIEIIDSTYTSNHPYKIGAYRNLAYFYTQRDNFSQASLYLDKCLDMALKSTEKDTITLIEVYNSLGNLSTKQNAFKEAKKNYDRAFELSEKYGKISDDLLSTYMGMATTYFHLGNSQKTKIFLNKSDSLIFELERLIYYESDRISLNKRAKNVYESAVKFLINTSETDKIFNFSEKSKASILEKALIKNQVKQNTISSNLLEIEEILNLDINAKKRALGRIKDVAKKDSVRKEIFKLERELEKHEQKLQKLYPDYYKVINTSRNIPKIAQIQKIVPDSSLVIEYSITDTLIAIQVFDKKSYAVVGVRKPDTFDKQLQTFKKIIRKDNLGKEKDFKESSYALYQILIKPVEDLLKGKDIKKLIIIPEDLLLQIPFGALISHKDSLTFATQPYLIRKYAIQYHYSASLWAMPQDTANKYMYDSILAFAPFAVLGEKASKILNQHTLRSGNNPLPASLQELEYILKYFQSQGDTTFLGFLAEKANEANFKKYCELYRFIHLATHGKADTENPNDSHIVFSEDSKVNIKEDGKLYLDEIYNLQLKAELAVLSACETGIGKLERGEGVISLNRAFLYAGCQNVLSSLWKVDDIATKDLMLTFYENFLKQKMDYATALQQAKLKIIETSPQPEFWASFIFIGK